MTYYGLLAFFALEYIRPGSYLPALNVLHLNSVVPLGIVVSSFASSPSAQWRALRESNVVLVLLLLGLIGVSVLTADVTLYAYEKFMAVLGYALITWVLAAQLTSRRQLEGALRTLVFVHVVVAAMTPDLLMNPEVRTYISTGSFLGDGNDFALSVNLVIPFCVFLWLNAGRRSARLVYAMTILFLVVCVIATQSRGGTVALACVGIYYWLRSDRKLALGFIIVLVVALVFLYAPTTYFDRMNQMNFEEGSAKGRKLAWQAAMRMAVDHPVLGVGAGQFPYSYGLNYRPPTGEQVPWQTAHSIYFLALGELGVPGLLLLLQMIFANLLANGRLAGLVRSRGGPHAKDATRLLTCLNASLIGFASGGAFLSANYYPHIYILLGLHAAARRLIGQRGDAPATANGAPSDATANDVLDRQPVGQMSQVYAAPRSPAVVM